MSNPPNESESFGISDSYIPNCKQIPISDLNNKSDQLKNKFSLLNFNIHSLPQHYEDLADLLSSLKIQISCIVITENWLNNTNETHYELPGYNAYHVHREGTRAGGVSIYVLKSFISSHSSHISGIDPIIATNSVNIEVGSSLIKFLGVYRPPRQ